MMKQTFIILLYKSVVALHILFKYSEVASIKKKCNELLKNAEKGSENDSIS